MNNIFASSLVISGSIIIAASNGNPIIFLGFLLITLGIAERYIPVLKNIFKQLK